MGPPTGDELVTMRRVVAEAMADGAFSVSYALIYPPESCVGTDEIIEVCREVARHGGLYVTQMRSEGDQLLAGLVEAACYAA